MNEKYNEVSYSDVLDENTKNNPDMLMHKVAMSSAIYEADLGISEKHGGPFGAVIRKGDYIVGIGHNRVLVDHDPTAHGEIEAIRNACRFLKTHDLSGCTIYTTGKPCPMCLAAIQWANIDKVYYGADSDAIADIGFRDKDMYEKASKLDVSHLNLCDNDIQALFQKYKELEHTIY